MIKARVLFKVVCLSSLVFSLNAQAQTQTNLKGCEAKKASLERQITYAKTYSNAHQVAGLQKALGEVNAHCTDAGLRTEREAKIREKQAKVTDRQVDLREAQATGDAKKIAKKQKKVQEAQVELKEAQSELNS